MAERNILLGRDLSRWFTSWILSFFLSSHRHIIRFSDCILHFLSNYNSLCRAKTEKFEWQVQVSVVSLLCFTPLHILAVTGIDQIEFEINNFFCFVAMIQAQ